MIAGAVTVPRLKGILRQLHHPARPPGQAHRVVVVSPDKPGPAMRALLDARRFQGKTTHIRGNPRVSADLDRAGAAGAGWVILLHEGQGNIQGTTGGVGGGDGSGATVNSSGAGGHSASDGSIVAMSLVAKRVAP